MDRYRYIMDRYRYIMDRYRYIMDRYPNHDRSPIYVLGRHPTVRDVPCAIAHYLSKLADYFSERFPCDISIKKNTSSNRY